MGIHYGFTIQFLLNTNILFDGVISIIPILIMAIILVYMLGRPLMVLVVDLIKMGYEKKGKQNESLYHEGPHPQYNGISIIVPCHNESNNIRMLIESLMKQKVSMPTEIILIENNSTDNTYEVCCELAKKYQNIRPLTLTTPKGVYPISAALNYGLEHTKYPIIVRIDADTELGHDLCIQYAIQPILDGEAVACATNVRVRNVKHSLVTRLQTIEYYFAMELDRRAQQIYQSVICISGAMQVFRLDLLKKVGGYNKSKYAAEDMDMTWQMHQFGKVRMVPEATSYTDVPQTWKELWNQRKHWMFVGVITLFQHRKKIGNRKYGHKGMLGLVGLPIKFVITFHTVFILFLQAFISYQFASSGNIASFINYFIGMSFIYILILIISMSILLPVAYVKQGANYWFLFPVFTTIYGIFLVIARIVGIAKAVIELYQQKKQKNYEELKQKYPQSPTLQQTTDFYSIPNKILEDSLHLIQKGDIEGGLSLLRVVLQHPDSSDFLRKLAYIKLNECIYELGFKKLSNRLYMAPGRKG